MYAKLQAMLHHVVQVKAHSDNLLTSESGCGGGGGGSSRGGRCAVRWPSGPHSIVIDSFPDCHESRVGNRSISDEVDRHCVPRADDGAWYVRTTISLFYRTEIDLNIVVWTYVVFTSCWRAKIEASGVLMAGLGSIGEGFKKEAKKIAVIPQVHQC